MTVCLPEGSYFSPGSPAGRWDPKLFGAGIRDPASTIPAAGQTRRRKPTPHPWGDLVEDSTKLTAAARGTHTRLPQLGESEIAKGVRRVGHAATRGVGVGRAASACALAIAFEIEVGRVTVDDDDLWLEPAYLLNERSMRVVGAILGS